MSLPLVFRLLAVTVLAGTGSTVWGSAPWTEPCPPIAFELGDGEQQPVARPSAEQWAALSPEERQQMRSQIRDHWRNMPPEERQKQREEMHERWQQMSPEERQQIRDTIRERRGRDEPPGQQFGPGRR